MIYHDYSWFTFQEWWVSALMIRGYLHFARLLDFFVVHWQIFRLNFTWIFLFSYRNGLSVVTWFITTSNSGCIHHESIHIYINPAKNVSPVKQPTCHQLSNFIMVYHGLSWKKSGFVLDQERLRLLNTLLKSCRNRRWHIAQVPRPGDTEKCTLCEFWCYLGCEGYIYIWL